MIISDNDKSIINLKDFIRDSSNKKIYRMTCKKCNKDRGYKRPVARKLACMSCGQKGKTSGKKGRKLTDQQKKNISLANLKWRRKIDPNYKPLDEIDKKLIKNLRIRLWQLIKSNSESFSKSIGCKTYELKYHLESQFQEGMSWDNYGRKNGIECWEIDHIRPLSSFDLNNAEDFKKANHYTNLQPLWVKDNRSKGAKSE